MPAAFEEIYARVFKRLLEREDCYTGSIWVYDENGIEKPGRRNLIIDGTVEVSDYEAEVLGWKKESIGLEKDGTPSF